VELIWSNVNVIAEHRLRVLVAAFDRRTGEADERCLRQGIAHVSGETVNEIVLAAVRWNQCWMPRWGQIPLSC
jgi:hypothetical protein